MDERSRARIDRAADHVHDMARRSGLTRTELAELAIATAAGVLNRAWLEHELTDDEMVAAISDAQFELRAIAVERTGRLQ
ncbi:hypothetical protein [Salinisphaera orenii]|nr:hypothetical protein [Salinisphaera orenii]